jgi:hypothetical protein
MARMLGLFSKHPIRRAHGRMPVLKGGIGIHGGDVGQWITALAGGRGSMQDQYQQAAAVEAVTAEGSAAMGGSKMASAMASCRERWQWMQGAISGSGSGGIWLILMLLCGN